MAISMLDNFNIRKSSPNVERDMFQTIADMACYNENYLPQVFIATCVADGCIYLFNKSNTSDPITGKWRKFEGGGNNETIQKTSLPTASSTELGNIYQYIGTSGNGVINGYFYKCVEVAESNPTEYQWQAVNVQPVQAVDSDLSSVSENPVQNKVITEQIQNIMGIINGETVETTYNGVPPLSVESDGTPASAYSITGKLVQSSSPTPTSPAYALEVGTLVSSGEHNGEYAIPITTGAGTQTVYLFTPLRKIDTYADVFSSAGTITRRIGKVVLDGTESFTNTTSAVAYTPKDSSHNMIMMTNSVCVCSHYIYSGKSISSSPNNSITTNGGNGQGIFIKTDYAGDKAAFATYAAAQYANGTPITIWFVLAEPITETFAHPPAILLTDGNNTISIDGTAPSDFSITCTKMIGGAKSASRISYNNTTSGLTAENVQSAVDEVVQMHNSQLRRLYCNGATHTTGTSGAIAAGETVTLSSTNCKKNNTYSFMAKIGEELASSESILIGQGFETYSGAWAEITNEKLIVHNYSQSDSTVEYTHGLTIDEYIYVQILVSIGKADIIIFSNGNTFKQTNVTWNACSGTLFAKPIGINLAHCMFTWSSADFRKSVWLFGDSYIGLNNPARWATVLRNAGFADNIYMNGYAGEASAAAITALTNALTYYGQPKTLVWCLGMNDGADNGDTPSNNWINGIEQVKNLCATYGIELVMATIPSVPNHSNEAKNTYVRTSGNRYIDFADAVGAQSDGTWYTDMLSNDNVHPSETGATALYHRAIADCPELTFQNP